MSNLNGFIKLHRKMIEWGWYSDCVVKDVFLHILMVANYTPGQYLGYELRPGQAVIGRKKMAQDLGFSEQQIRTALKKLESTGEISIKSTNKFSIATVENWAFYQCEENLSTNEQPTINQQSTNNQPTNNQQVTTPKESKKERKQESKKARNSLVPNGTCEETSREVQQVVECWNETSFPPISRLSNTSNRYKMLVARLKEYGVEKVLYAISIAEQSDFLKGGSKRGWIMDFEWFVKPNNFPKVLEGSYQNKTQSKFDAVDIWLGGQDD